MAFESRSTCGAEASNQPESQLVALLLLIEHYIPDSNKANFGELKREET
jgi:hypothetical protein